MLQRVQQETTGPRDRSGDRLYGIRRALHTGVDIIGEKQWAASNTRSSTSSRFRPSGTSSGPAEAINGRLEHLRGSALSFRNLTNYIAPYSNPAASDPNYTPECEEPTNFVKDLVNHA